MHISTLTYAKPAKVPMQNSMQNILKKIAAFILEAFTSKEQISVFSDSLL